MNRIVLVAGATLAFAACGGDSHEQDSRVLEPVDVTVSQAHMGSAESTFPARVVPVQEAEVATRMAGTISRMAVQVGERVSAGDLIASLDDSDVQARIEAARAQARLAEQTFDRVESLARDGAASAQELDQARAGMESAEAMVREAEAQASYVVIRAPFAGVVTARMADAGDMASPGQPLVQLSGSGVKVVAEIPASRAGEIREGQSVALETDLGRMEGTVRRVVPAVNRASRRFQVEVAPATGEGLLPGGFVRLRFQDGEAATTRWLPMDAVVRNGQLTGIFTVRDDTLHLRWVRLGREAGDRVELLAGPPGDLTVVRNPSSDLRDGQPVSRATTQPFGEREEDPGDDVAAMSAGTSSSTQEA